MKRQYEITKGTQYDTEGAHVAWGPNYANYNRDDEELFAEMLAEYGILEGAA